MKMEKFLSHGSKKFLLKTITFTKWPTYCCHQHHCYPIFNKTFMLTYVHMLHMICCSICYIQTLYFIHCENLTVIACCCREFLDFSGGSKLLCGNVRKFPVAKKWLCSSCSAHSNYSRAELWYLKLFDFQRFLSLKTESKVEFIKSLNTEFIDFVIRILTPF